MGDAANPRDLRAKKVVRRTLPKLKADMVPKLKQDSLWHYQQALKERRKIEKLSANNKVNTLKNINNNYGIGPKMNRTAVSF